MTQNIFNGNGSLKKLVVDVVERMKDAVRTTPAGQPVRLHFLSWRVRRGGWKEISGRGEQARAMDYLNANGLRFSRGNDAPRGGAQGDYIELAPETCRHLLNGGIASAEMTDDDRDAFAEAYAEEMAELEPRYNFKADCEGQDPWCAPWTCSSPSEYWLPGLTAEGNGRRWAHLSLAGVTECIEYYEAERVES